MHSERNLEPIEGFPQIFPGMLIRCEKITRSQGKEYLKRINAQCTELLMQFIVKVFKVVVEKKSTPTSTCEYYPFIRVSQVHHFFFFFLEKERVALFICQAKEEHSSLPQELSVQFSRSVTCDSLRPHALHIPGFLSITNSWSLFRPIPLSW